LYSTFPGNWPSAGLLVLRVAIGVTFIIQGVSLYEVQDVRNTMLALSLCTLVSGGLLVLGFLTPIAGALGVLSGLVMTLLSPSLIGGNFLAGNPLSMDVLIMAFVAGVVGPGAFSLDAHFFSRRKVIIPRSSHSNPGLASPFYPGSPSRVPDAPASRAKSSASSSQS
jgi:uncharacterized membrane protein YphA (DoxX/SURF4 family)